MKINKRLSEFDPARYTVYQMLNYFKKRVGVKLIQKKTANLLFFKTVPGIDSLYNSAHVVGKDLTKKDISISREFFGANDFRVETLDQEDFKQLLAANGFKLKKTDYVMIAREFDRNKMFCSLPKNTNIFCATNRKMLEDAKEVFAEAFNYQVTDYNRKFGFLDEAMMDEKEDHVKAFVLYKKTQPVSTGSYYAFDKFSIENIGTIKSGRGRGYATLIIQRLLQEARRLGYREAYLGASEVGKSVYEKAGFKTISKINTFIDYLKTTVS